MRGFLTLRVGGAWLIGIAAVVAAAHLSSAASTPTAIGAASSPQASKHYSPGQVGLFSRQVFVALGNRLSTVGQERQVLQGSLVQPGRSANPLAVTVTEDVSESLRIDFSTGGLFSVVFNGQQLATTVASVLSGTTTENQQLADSLQYDSPEHFLIGGIQGTPVQKIGSSVKLTDALSSAAPAEYCDAYRTLEASPAGWRPQGQVKMYCFDSKTHLLAAVFYQIAGPPKVYVETRYSGWHGIGTTGTMVPGVVQRRENNVVQFTFTVQTATVAPETADSLFVVP